MFYKRFELKILKNIRVLDFGRYIAGPYCGALLGDLGAEVIRIERLDGSEDRFIHPLKDEGGEGAMFMQMNRNKKGMTLNPTKEGSATIVEKLIKSADVVIANLPPQTLKRMGIDYETISKYNPGIILTTVSAFGAGGPYSERVGFDGVGQAMSGAAYLTGGESEPVKAYSPYIDYGTASLTAMGTLAAIIDRNETGKGQIVEGALFATSLAFMNTHLIEQSITKKNRKAIGNRSPYAGPVDMVETKDGWIVVQVLGDALFKRWANLVGAEDLLDDDRFSTDINRGVNGEILSKKTSDWASQFTNEEALNLLANANVPAGPVNDLQNALDDPHVKAMNFFQDLEYPGIPGKSPVMGLPVKLSNSDNTIDRRPPILGEHTEEILIDLGFTNDEIDEFKEKRII
jgi:crotonobetainyl-CoA:carnitine CoA-transferase CaiB-like acyl-CoA transferase